MPEDRNVPAFQDAMVPENKLFNRLTESFLIPGGVCWLSRLGEILFEMNRHLFDRRYLFPDFSLDIRCQRMSLDECVSLAILDIKVDEITPSRTMDFKVVRRRKSLAHHDHPHLVGNRFILGLHRLSVNGDISFGVNRLDGPLDVVDDTVGAVEWHGPAKSNCCINKCFRPGHPDPQQPYFLHPVHSLDALFNLLCEPFWDTIHQRVDGTSAEPIAHDQHHDSHRQRRDRIETGIAERHENQSSENSQRCPDVTREMQSVRFQGLALVFFGDTAERTGSTDVDDDGNHNDNETPHCRVDMCRSCDQTFNPLPDNPSARGNQEQGLKQSGNVFHLPVTVLVVSVRRFIRNTDCNKRDECREQIQSRMRRFREDSKAVRRKPYNELHSGESRSGKHGTQGNRFFFARCVVVHQ